MFTSSSYKTKLKQRIFLTHQSDRSKRSESLVLQCMLGVSRGQRLRVWDLASHRPSSKDLWTWGKDLSLSKLQLLLL